MMQLATDPQAPLPGCAERQPIQWRLLIIGSLALIGLSSALQSPHMELLMLTGAALGLTMQQAAFGFTSAYRRFLLRRETDALYAQLLMLALATLLFAPALAKGIVFGQPVFGALAPTSVSVVVGAFFFGIGMQLGDGCGSGTLYKAGSGIQRSFITLAAFCAGSFWASLQMAFWQRLPSLGTISLARPFGYFPAAMLQLAIIGAIALALRRWKNHQPTRNVATEGWRRFRVGPWPMASGGILLALLNFITLVAAGHPWTITWGFTLWGAKAAMLFGWDPSSSTFWNAPFQHAALESSVLQDVTSVMDIGIMLGALVGAALAGRVGRLSRISFRSFIAAILGGLLMGYGARIAYGCNVGAFFSGVASLSLHGWLWIACALLGNALGVRWRPLFGLTN